MAAVQMYQHGIIKQRLFILFIFITSLPLSSTLLISQSISPYIIKLGAIFERDNEHLVTAFLHAINHINTNRTLLVGHRIEPLIRRIKPHDSFHASRQACDLIHQGAWAIFGPKSPSANWMLRSMSASLNVPHVSMFWDFRNPNPTAPSFRDPDDHRLFAEMISPSAFTINFYPEASSLSTALLDFIISRGWKSFTLVYENNESLIKLKDILRATDLRPEIKMRLRHAHIESDHDLDLDTNFRKIFKDINKFGETNIVPAVAHQYVQPMLLAAKSIGMMTEYHNFLVATLDLHTIDLSEFQDTQTNITGLSLLDANDNILNPLLYFAGRRQQLRDFGPTWDFAYDEMEPLPGPLSTEQALVYDAVHHFAKAVDEMLRKRTMMFGPERYAHVGVPYGVQASPMLVGRSPIERLSAAQSFPDSTSRLGNCTTGDVWAQGQDLLYHMKRTRIRGLTGRIMFDHEGKRSDFRLRVLELKPSGLTEVGTWSMKSGINVTANFTELSVLIKEQLANRTLRVTTALAKPYMMLKEGHENLPDEEKFEGYCVDLLNAIANKLGFKYTIGLVKDGNYGSCNSRGECNGMIKELQERVADLAITDFTITATRQSAVDFTMPFMNLGISILFKKPEEKQPELFQFLKPFSVEVWLYIASSFIGVSLLLWMLARITPYEWVAAHPCDREPPELENQFSLGAGIWFVLGSIMQQGSDLAPKALSTRSLATVWWFFTLIMISSYTANLAAFLTVSRMASPIESAEDLAKQTTIQYGCKKGGATLGFFMKSKHPTYQRMWSFMESAVPSVFLETNEHGIERVKKGGYAFLMESTSIKYIVQRECDLTQIGGELDSKGYGIALPFNSPYRGLISLAIVQLRESNVLRELETKWWIKRGGGKCGDETKVATSTSEMDIGSVGGVFLVLTIGVLFSCVLVAIEFIWKMLKISRHEREPILVELIMELKRIFTGGGSSRPIRVQFDTQISMQSARSQISNSSKTKDKVQPQDVPQTDERHQPREVFQPHEVPPPLDMPSNHRQVYEPDQLDTIQIKPLQMNGIPPPYPVRSIDDYDGEEFRPSYRPDIVYFESIPNSF